MIKTSSRFLLSLIAAAGAVVGGGSAMADQLVIIDFSKNDRSQWVAVNDGVMGGVSQSAIRRTDDGTGVFAGVLSLENNGGFASVRAMVGTRDLSAYAGVEIRVRGDGRTYQLRLRDDERFDGIAFRAEFATTAGEWTTHTISFDDFVPSFRGRTVPDAAPLDTARIAQIAFMVADKQAGPFSLEIARVSAYGTAHE